MEKQQNDKSTQIRHLVFILYTENRAKHQNAQNNKYTTVCNARNSIYVKYIRISIIFEI